MTAEELTPDSLGALFAYSESGHWVMTENADSMWYTDRKHLWAETIFHGVKTVRKKFKWPSVDLVTLVLAHGHHGFTIIKVNLQGWDFEIMAKDEVPEWGAE